ncbi:hypothetical protein EON67_02050 [archaeon]|nr:MAG: hypothetical protein EON67_02050 [archaeon]
MSAGRSGRHFHLRNQIASIPLAHSTYADNATHSHARGRRAGACRWRWYVRRDSGGTFFTVPPLSSVGSHASTAPALRRAHTCPPRGLLARPMKALLRSICWSTPWNVVCLAVSLPALYADDLRLTFVPPAYNAALSPLIFAALVCLLLELAMKATVVDGYLPHVRLHALRAAATSPSTSSADVLGGPPPSTHRAAFVKQGDEERGARHTPSHPKARVVVVARGEASCCVRTCRRARCGRRLCDTATHCVPPRAYASCGSCAAASPSKVMARVRMIWGAIDLGSFYLWLDVASVISLALELPQMFSNEPSILVGDSSEQIAYVTLARLGRVCRAGARLGAVLQLLQQEYVQAWLHARWARGCAPCPRPRASTARSSTPHRTLLHAPNCVKHHGTVSRAASAVLHAVFAPHVLLRDCARSPRGHLQTWTRRSACSRAAVPCAVVHSLMHLVAHRNAWACASRTL